ncbi:MAG: hypothetical protein C0622_14350 [Desulfuromonas sp.]|nr:MAG: hypothetical protein C0622_14350 [Desulfuromonas sp.]
MRKKQALVRVAPEDLPEALLALDEQKTGLAFFGPNVRVPKSPDYWPEWLNNCYVFQLTEACSVLPSELLCFHRLQKLILYSLDLQSEDIIDIAEHLVQLTSLNLSRNEIGAAGAQAIAEHLVQLTSLDLSYNGIGAAGAQAIGEHLTQLTSLNLSRNEIGDAGAQAIAEHLVQLTSLYLSSNEIGDAGARAIGEHLVQLTSLDLSRNRIGDAGAQAIGEQLTNLNRLDLQGNEQIRFFAPNPHSLCPLINLANTGLSDLTPLKSFILSGVAVKWSGAWWEGPGLYVKNCPLTQPSPEIIQQGQEAVCNYFREIEEQGTDRLFEAKLLIVGEGGAGKTSLMRRMFFPDMDLPDEEETTRGIDIHHHDFPLTDGRSFRLNVWDFGGQQIYHATHQFFLTKRSLYVLVDDTRSDYRTIHDEIFKFWLEVVETLSENSPLLIFQNEKGGRSKQIDMAGIKGRFDNVVDLHRGNLESLHAADGLRQAVEYFAQKLPHIGEDVPAKWIPIRKDIESLAQKNPFIPLETYFDVYRRHLQFDQNKALQLSQYFHDLGVLLHFQHPRELHHTVFLQNQWVTDAVFRILDDEQIKEQQGRFTLADCDRLWADCGYADKEVELRALMVRFELCYRLPDQCDEVWLVPQHLSPSKPTELNDWNRDGDLMLTYRYEFLPRGLVSRLIVRMHRFVKNTELCWVRGALFIHGDTQVLVETSSSGSEIVLRARGPEKQSLLSVIASDLDALNDSFEGLKDRVGKWVPCICPTCEKLKEPAMFKQKELLERKRRGKPTIECPKPPNYEDVSVLQLLDGMNLDEWLKRAEKELPQNGDQSEQSSEPEHCMPEQVQTVKTTKIFLASSAELREDRDAFDLYFRQQNDRLRKQGLYLEINRWENFLDAMSETRLQDEYNDAVRGCDIFVSLFKTKTGKYTEEEFDVAHRTFKELGKPLIYTYFRKTNVSTSASNRNDLMSLWDFQQKLSDLGHFQTEYDSIDGLKSHFRDQLDKLSDEGRL